MGLNISKDFNGAKVTYLNVKGVGNVALDFDKKEIRMTVKPSVFVTQEYRDKKGSPLVDGDSNGTFNEDVVLGKDYFDNFVKGIYEGLKKKDSYKKAKDC